MATDLRTRQRNEPLEPKVVEGRVPPHDLDAEAAILSAVLIDEKALDKVLGFLKPEHFYSEMHRRIYEAAVELRAKSQPVDIVQVGTWLKNRERLEQVGGMAYLTQILDAAPVVSNVEAYGLTVREKSRERRMIALCQRASAQGYLDHGDAQSWLAEVAEETHKIAHDELSRSRTVRINEALAESVKDIQLARARGGVVGTPTGLRRLDRVMGGLHASDLTIVAALPGMGKTSLVANVLVNVAAHHEGDEICGAAIFSLEMPKKQIANRMSFSEARVNLSKARTGDLSPVEWQRLANASQFLGKLPLWIDDQAAITLMELRAKVRALQAEFDRPATEIDGQKKRARRLAVVAVDYLQLMKPSVSRDSREREVSELSRGLKELAKECGIAVIALSQLNREVEKRGNKRPQLSDLRESGAIGADADNVLFIYRDEKYNPHTDDKNIAEIIVAKQRNGETGFVKVRFDEEYTRFDNLADGDYVDGGAHGP